MGGVNSANLMRSHCFTVYLVSHYRLHFTSYTEPCLKTLRHRRELKRMRNKQKNKMAVIKFDIEKRQMETLLESQMAQYQNTMNVAMSDGVIDNSEAAILRQQLAQLEQPHKASTRLHPSKSP